MRRNALSAFFRRAVIAALPLAGCSSPPSNDPAPYKVPNTLTDDGGTRTFQVGDVISFEDCVALCNPPTHFVNCHAENDNGKVVVVCQPYTDHTGRMPARFRPSPPAEGDELGRLFAAASQLEAASVHAFRILAAELRALGAPERLVQAARHAAADEIRHARATARLARRFGAEPLDARVEPRALRPLGEVALENAIEGCVRETWGALLATWQAEAAEDPGVRATMAAIAPDETRHAELAWEIDAWAASQLSVTAYDRINAARRAAVEELNRSLGAPASERLRTRAGVPTPLVARKLFASAGKLWS
jgi:hypothetical protein